MFLEGLGLCVSILALFIYFRLFYAACLYEGRISQCSSVFLPVRTMACNRGGMPVTPYKLIEKNTLTVSVSAKR
jgi:hypothetical protein